MVIRNKRIHYNIVFAKGGANLPIAHAFRLPETERISWGGDFFGTGDFLEFFWGRGFFFFFFGRFFLGQRIFLGAGDF